ncbi:unnamed protein product [Caenorhabditis auriculariae]|uniref:Uncharacterized protein n=1 Tax=Caenorhabditis auriculariae TaxID=2777116 RepID=A0A8S1HIT9_9PELO|nr:unnamed protein product [Caenorhabditis auriculariae]
MARRRRLASTSAAAAAAKQVMITPFLLQFFDNSSTASHTHVHTYTSTASSVICDVFDTKLCRWVQRKTTILQ